MHLPMHYEVLEIGKKQSFKINAEYSISLISHPVFFTFLLIRKIKYPVVDLLIISNNPAFLALYFIPLPLVHSDHATY